MLCSQTHFVLKLLIVFEKLKAGTHSGPHLEQRILDLSHSTHVHFEDTHFHSQVVQHNVV